MRIIAIILILAAAANTIQAQDPGALTKKEQRKLLKEERKRAAAEMEAAMAAYVDSIVNADGFILEAHTLFDRYGQSFPVQSNINFVAVDREMGVFQIGNPFYIGRNGVGGVTYEGAINSYEKTHNEKRGTYYVKFTLQTPLGHFDIDLNILSSGRADATVRGNFGGSIRYSGDIVGLQESRIFKGSSF